jgi:hypothetical protein
MFTRKNRALHSTISKTIGLRGSERREKFAKFDGEGRESADRTRESSF